MCGIVGFRGNGDDNSLKQMAQTIVHRGPNSFGSFIDTSIGIGCQRLSVIDLQTGNQPIHNEDGSCWIVFNGEIYNYKKLQVELKSKGHRFYTNTDTECIIHAYDEWGEECVNYLVGMFGFAIWDQNKKKLILARDRIGEKPLYYSVVDGSLIFGSEVKSILQYPTFPRRVNPLAIYYYLTFRFNPLSQTAFEGIHKLPPGHMLVYDADGLRLRRYWDFSFFSVQYSQEEQAVQLLRKLLMESVEARMVSDVPLGAYLSGGLDSSAVVLMMSKISSDPVKTFSIGFAEEDYNELPYARMVADELGTDHHEFIVGPDSSKLLPSIAYHLDEPMGDPAVLPTYILSENTARFCTVVLTGEGGDEQFAGYEHYKIMLRTQRFKSGLSKSFLKVSVNLMSGNLDKIFKYSSALGKKGMGRVNDYLNDLGKTEQSYLDIVSIFTPKEIERLSPQIADSMIGHEPATYLKSLSDARVEDTRLLPAIQRIEFKTSLSEGLLMKVDKMTMAHSLEARVPLLDHGLVEMCARMSDSLKIQNGIDKYIFRQAVKDIIPESIRNRPKQRFFVPIHTWLNGEMGDIIFQLLERSSTEGRVQQYYVNELKSDLISSPLYAARQLWSLAMYELWHRIFFEQDRINPKLSLNDIIYS